MRNSKVLEMLNNGQIEQLKAELEDEIYQESLTGKPNAKKRYAAMKKYLKNSDSGREILQKPCMVDFEGDQYAAFCNAYTLALTTETCGEIPMCEEPDRYPNVTRMISYSGDEGTIDFADVLAKAKSKGYKFKKSEIGFDYKYLMKYDGAYFKIGLIDVTYGVIDDGKEATVYHRKGDSKHPLTIKNGIGVCVIMPMRIDGSPSEDITVISVE